MQKPQYKMWNWGSYFLYITLLFAPYPFGYQISQPWYLLAALISFQIGLLIGFRLTRRES